MSSTYSTTSSTVGNPPPTRLGPVEARRYLEEGLQGHLEKFQFGGAAQYAVYIPVSDEEFTKIDNARNRHPKSLRSLYLTNKIVLIVKFIVGIVHGVAHGRFVAIFMH
ncbi:hypothetical protein B9Z19DRAFT_1125933 [Tuber borchii]|uniref:Uncharacterized protein n=1 Tax=Tuber borchii TaxID=42251 RepID=A0A2T6ZTU5_TUBBO|nr:hypothetical protein B9Z19DRAFT_1125933 [Tuber borchii]